jgi:hypothetical protein
MYRENFHPKLHFNSLEQRYSLTTHWKNPSFELWKVLFGKCLLEHRKGASIIGLASDNNFKNNIFKDYIKPVAKCYPAPPMKYKRRCKPYSGKLAAPTMIFELLSPK